MKILRSLSLVLFSIILASVIVACGKKATCLECEFTNIELDNEAHTETIEMVTDGKEIAVADKPDWVMTKTEGKVLTYAVVENLDGADREGDIIITCDALTFTLHIAQITPATRLTTNPTALSFRSAGGSMTVKVDTDAKTVKVNAPQGIDAQYSAGTLTVTAAPGASAAGGAVVLTAGKIEVSLPISQAPDYCTACGGRGQVKCAHCGGRGCTEYTTCGTCYETGWVICTRCGGTGR